MTALPPPRRQTDRRALTGLADLSRDGLIPPGAEAALRDVAETFRIRITPEMRAAIATPDDAVGRQFVPTLAEAVVNDGDLHDPIGDRVHLAAPV